MIIKNDRGTTLIELIAVIALISIVLILIISSQLTWFKNTNNLSEQTLNQEKLRFAFEQMVKDIEEAAEVSLNSYPSSDQTHFLNITKQSGDLVVYGYDISTSRLFVDKMGNTIFLVENMNSFIINYIDKTYYIEGIINDIDVKTGQPYKIMTSAKMIEW